MLFTDHSEHPIDAKGRLAIPARYRNAWDVQRDGPCWMCVPWTGSNGQLGTIRLYTYNTFQALSARYGGSLTPSSDEAQLELTLFSFAKQLEMDGEGRVVLPSKYLAMTGVGQAAGKKVVVAGVQNRLEIHDAAAWDAMELERFKSLPGLIERIERARRE